MERMGCQWIGLRENLQEKPIEIMVKTNPSRFSSCFCVKNGWEVLNIISMDDTGGHAENQSYIPHNDLTVLPKPLLEIIVNFRGIIPKWPN